MASGKLVFGAVADGTGRLVFGEAGSVVIPDAVLSVDADLPGLGELTLRAGVVLGMDADLPGLDGDIDLLWDANVSRGTRVTLEAHWQEAQPVACGVAAGTMAAAESDKAGVTAAPTAGGGVAGRDTVATCAGRLRSGV